MAESELMYVCETCPSSPSSPLPRMLTTIELCQRGFFVPFMFISKPAKYGFTITPDYRDKGRSASALAIADRAKLLEAVRAEDAVHDSLRLSDGSYF